MELIREFKDRGIELIPDGEKLKVRGELTDYDRQRIRSHKPEILSIMGKIERVKEIANVLDQNILSFDDALTLVREAEGLWLQIPRELLPDLSRDN